MSALHYGSRGAEVKALQRELNANPFRKLSRKLAIDGELGPHTASAIHSVKYWAGYAAGNIDPDLPDQVAGALFRALITKRKPLPPAYLERRRARLRKARAAWLRRKLRTKILAAARKDVGLLEGPRNAIKYNSWWTGGRQDGGAYCVRAGSYWAKKAGCPHISPAAGRFENTDYLLACAKAGKNGVHLVSDPKPGNGFVIDWSGHSDPDHYGVAVTAPKFGTFRSLEANATLSDGRQGVGYHDRPARQCWFIEFED